MDKIKFEDVNILDVGNTIQMAGVIWTGHNSKDHSPIAFVTEFPHKDEDFSNLKRLPMSLEQWETFIKQTDLLETEIIGEDENGKVVKATWRKSQRAVDAFMNWSVFKRDGYKCRYCGADGIPLTVDHIIPYEVGGPTIPANLLTACKPCNKDRGNLPYDKWINSDLYKKKSKNLLCIEDDKNVELIAQLPELEKLVVKNIRSRK